jgi:hypothetical protein
MATQQQIDSTTQQFLDIYDITNNLVILKDGTTSLIVTVDAMNFGLLAEEEQDSIMYAYAGLLNSLNYPIQIIVKSKTKDVTGYLNLLKEQEDKSVNRVHQQRIMKYREFVSNLIRERNVLDKKFYVTIPAKPLELGLMPVSSVIPGKNQTDISTVDKNMIIEKAKTILEPKRDHLIAQFARIGLYSRQLETQEIIQMFYQSYNPEASEGQTMDDSRSYTTPLVSASIEENKMDISNNSTQPNQPAGSAPQTAPATPVVETNVSTPVLNMPESGATPNSNETQETGTVSNTAPQTSNPQSSVPTPVPSASGYVPTQMNNTTNVTDEKSAPELSATPTPPPVVESPPLPPTPELPKTAPGVDDNTVPKEVEITINHPSEKNNSQDSTTSGSEVKPMETNPTPDISPAPQSTSVSESVSTDQPKDNAPMPPLPEIQ